MRISNIAKDDFIYRFRTKGVAVDFGAASFLVRSPIYPVASTFYDLYHNHPFRNHDDWNDFSIEVTKPGNLRDFIHPQAIFKFEGQKPFYPLPYSQSYPLMEWGMNWCVANHFHQYLIFHAAVLEKNGCAVIFPAPPGSGKSTLCSYLAHSGWRLLSDEMAILDIQTGEVIPFVRGICLKNDAISIFKRWFPDKFVSPVALDTNKGNVAHVQPPINAIERLHIKAPVSAVVFPAYQAGSGCLPEPVNNTDTMRALIDNAFNYTVLGKTAFDVLTQLIDKVRGYRLVYSDIEQAEAFLSELVDESL